MGVATLILFIGIGVTHYGSGISPQAHKIRIVGFGSLVAFGAVPSLRKLFNSTSISSSSSSSISSSSNYCFDSSGYYMIAV